MESNLENMRQHYDHARLEKKDLSEDPYILWNEWFQSALKHPEIIEPNIMAIATVNSYGQPSCRNVLLKGMIDDKDFVFYTNYQSDKGQDLEQNNKVALLFYWGPLQRQVRIEGRAYKVSRQRSEQYFNKRPLGSRVAAYVSPQSKKITYEKLYSDYVDKMKSVENEHVDCPDHWGGYAISANKIEFWQGGEYRLHDRWVYQKTDKSWKKFRIAP